MSALSHPVYIVTGASRGYGLAIVRQLFALSPHCHILGTARDADKLSALHPQFPSSQWDFVAGDIADFSVAKACVDRVISQWGRLDGIVHNAGVVEPMGPVATIPISEFRQLMDVNLTSVLQLTQLALPHLRQSPMGLGRMVLISSGAANRAYNGWAPYCMSKVALNMLGQVLALEEPKVVTVSLRPGVLDTDMQGIVRDKGQGKLNTDMHQYFVDLHKDGKLVPPHESAQVAAQLLLHAPRELSGQFVDWQDDKVNNWQLK